MSCNTNETLTSAVRGARIAGMTNSILLSNPHGQIAEGRLAH